MDGRPVELTFLTCQTAGSSDSDYLDGASRNWRPTDDPEMLRRVASYFSELEAPAARRDAARLQVRLDKLRAIRGPAEPKSLIPP